MIYNAAKNKWLREHQRNVARFIEELNSCAAIEGAGLDSIQRAKLQVKLEDVLQYIDTLDK